MSETLTLGTLFDLSAADDPKRLPTAWEPFRRKLSDEVKEIKWPAAMPDLAVAIADLLDVQIPPLLVSAWQKAAEVRTKLAESRVAPNDVTYLELARHTIASSFHPYITVKVAGAQVKELKFRVTVSFILNGFVLQIQDGAIREIRTGHCDAEGKVEGLGLVIAEKKLARVSLPGSIAISEARHLPEVT